MTTRRRFRRFFLLLLLLALAFGGIWTALWYNVSGRLMGQIASFEAARRAEGWRISHDAPVRTGWPMAAGVRLGHLVVSGGGAYLPGGIGWTAAGLTVALDIRHPHSLYLGLAGRQSLAIGGAAPIRFQAAHMAGEAAFGPGWTLGLTQISAESILAAVPAQGGLKPLSIARMAAALRLDRGAPASGTAVAFAGQLEGAQLPPSHMAALGTVGRLGVDFVLSGPWPAEAARQDAAQNARRWAAAGGSLTLHRAVLEAGPLHLTAAGSLHLDAALRPAGLLSLEVSGLGQSLKLLAARKVMTQNQARAMAAVLAVLRQPAAPGNAIALPLSLQGGVAGIGPVPLWRLGR
ncbi:DUF2125 domain-containing protein [Acidisoma sp. C75]